jgi:molecular chaperone IbpA
MTKTLTPEWLLRHAIGFDNYVFNAATVPSFPPHNIEKLTEDHYRLTLAVAGFARDDISLSVHKGFLTIKGSRKASEETREFLYKGIAERDFEREFKLGEHVRVTGASLADGLLVVDLEREIPEEDRPQTVAIR